MLDGHFLFEVGEAGLWRPEQRAAEIRSTLRAALVVLWAMVARVTSLLEAARVHPAVLPEPRPEVRFNGFGGSALDFALLVWTADPAGQELLRSDLNYQIERNPRRVAIEVPFPQRTLHLAPASLDALAARLNGESPPARPAHPTQPPDDAPAFPAAPWRGASARR